MNFSVISPIHSINHYVITIISNRNEKIELTDWKLNLSTEFISDARKNIKRRDDIFQNITIIINYIN